MKTMLSVNATLTFASIINDVNFIHFLPVSLTRQF